MTKTVGGNNTGSLCRYKQKERNVSENATQSIDEVFKRRIEIGNTGMDPIRLSE